MATKHNVRDKSGRFTSVINNVVSASRTGSRKKKQLVNNICLILDDSASMGIIAESAHQAFNSWLQKIKDEAARTAQQTLVSLVMFGSQIDQRFHRWDAQIVPNITYYHPNQRSTRLFDAVNYGIELLDGPSYASFNDDESFLVVVVTDGQENASGSNAVARAVETMREKVDTDKWTFVFMVPRGSKRSFCRQYGVVEGNVQEWEQTEVGTRDVEVKTSGGIKHYFDSRAMGYSSVQNFYVQPDLSDVKTSDLKKSLTDLQRECIIATVGPEEPIKDFVEDKMRLPYRAGEAYYQLSKPEKVGKKKQVLIMEKGKPQVWGGSEARDLIGLPHNADAKVTPGNHSKYDIFVQSTSYNRIVVRGTKVIVRNRFLNAR